MTWTFLRNKTEGCPMLEEQLVNQLFLATPFRRVKSPVLPFMEVLPYPPPPSIECPSLPQIGGTNWRNPECLARWDQLTNTVLEPIQIPTSKIFIVGVESEPCPRWPKASLRELLTRRMHIGHEELERSKLFCKISERGFFSSFSPSSKGA